MQIPIMQWRDKLNLLKWWRILACKVSTTNQTKVIKEINVKNWGKTHIMYQVIQDGVSLKHSTASRTHPTGWPLAHEESPWPWLATKVLVPPWNSVVGTDLLISDLSQTRSHVSPLYFSKQLCKIEKTVIKWWNYL